MFSDKSTALNTAKATALRDKKPRFVHCWNGQWYVGKTHVNGAILVPVPCLECETYPADLPGDLCLGCEAYKDHTSIY